MTATAAAGAIEMMTTGATVRAGETVMTIVAVMIGGRAGAMMIAGVATTDVEVVAASKKTCRMTFHSDGGDLAR